MEKEKSEQKPLTLEQLAEYNQAVLFPALEERIVTKRDFRHLKTDVKGLKTDVGVLKADVKGLKTDVGVLKADVGGLKTDLGGLRKEFQDFKNRTLTSQDKMLKKLDTLLTEKTVREYQEKKEKKLWAIIIKSLKEHQILSPKDLEEIAQLEIF